MNLQMWVVPVACPIKNGQRWEIRKSIYALIVTPSLPALKKIVDAEGRVERFNKKYAKTATTKTKAKA